MYTMSPADTLPPQRAAVLAFLRLELAAGRGGRVSIGLMVYICTPIRLRRRDWTAARPQVPPVARPAASFPRPRRPLVGPPAPVQSPDCASGGGPSHCG